MMENKYYTPDIEDIRVGYECELNYTSVTPNEVKKGWLPYIVSVTNDFEVLEKAAKSGMIRTPYLTKEQIEDEGWNILQIYPNGALIFLKGTIDDGYELLWEQNKSIKITKVWSIFDGEKYLRSDIYIGDSPSINEFRYITNKLLKIK